MDYVEQRLEQEVGLRRVHAFLKLVFSKIKRCGVALKPKFFSKVLIRVHELAVSAILQLMKPISQTTDPFIK